MRPLTDNERFTPTQPLPECQDRLRKQRRWTRTIYTPNDVPLSHRILYGLISLTWVGWAMIGLLSGHMFFLVSKRGAIHFSGVPAMLFSAAVVACAIACVVTIVDHYDRRDNEESYRRVRRRAWLTAMVFFCLSGCMGLAERVDVLPFTDSKLGLLSTDRLKPLLAFRRLDEMLAPHRATLDRWSVMSMLLWVVGAGAFKLLGLLKDGSTPRPAVALFVILCLVGPALATFTLSLLAVLASGSFPSRPLSDELVRAQIAWMQSMLVACLAMLTLLGFTLCVLVLRAVGIFPKESAQRGEEAS